MARWYLTAEVPEIPDRAAEVRGIIQRAALALDEYGVDYSVGRVTPDSDLVPVQGRWFNDDGSPTDWDGTYPNGD